MAIPRRLLNDDEAVLVSTRTHAKALLGPLLVLIVVAAAAGLVGSLAPSAGRARPLLLAVIWGAAALLALRWVVRPFLSWLTTTYTLTDQRLITRAGVLSRRGHDIPLSRISDVRYERGLVDRVLGAGTLLVAVAGEHRVELQDIPHVEHVHLTVQDLLHDAAATTAADRRAPRLDGGR